MVKNPPMKFLVTPERIGRHTDVKPFTIQLYEHRRYTADVLAEKLHKAVRKYLLSDRYSTVVDIDKGVFHITLGRHGQGTIEKVEEE